MATPLRREVLDTETLEAALRDRPAVRLVDGQLHTTFECPSFAAAIGLVTEVGFAAEALDHHPDIDIRWRRVSFGLSTHDRGGITDFDLALADRIAEIAAGRGLIGEAA